MYLYKERVEQIEADGRTTTVVHIEYVHASSWTQAGPRV